MRDGTDRGVSDLVGFVILFAMVASMVGAVYAGGVVELQATTDAQRVESAERAFGSLAGNIEDLSTGGSPTRTTTLALGGGRLSVGDPVDVEVRLTDAGETYSAAVHPIVYRSENGARVVYENGMVIRDGKRGEPRVVHEPPTLVGGRTVLPLLRTRPGGGGAVGGHETARVQTRLADREVYASHTGGSYDVVLSVTSPRHEAWAAHLEREGATCTTTDETVECAFDATSVRVPLVRIDVSVA